MRTRLLVALCAVVVGACISCDNTIYRIEMTPHDDQMSRQLDMTRNGASSAPVTRPVGSAATQPYEGAFPAEMVQHMAGQYSQSRQTAANEVVFLGDFRNKMPDDVGNLGHFQVFSDPMGTANVYLEQFRGQSDQVPNVQRVLESAGMLRDVFIACLSQNLSHDPAWPEFERFLKSGFRDDLRNLAMDLYITRAARTVCSESSMLNLDGATLMPMWQFAIEHGYSTLDDLPAFKTLGDKDAVGPNILQRIIGRKMGLPAEQWEKRLAFLADRDALGKSLAAAAESQDSYKQWKQRKLTASQPASRPNVMEPAPSTQPAEEVRPEDFLAELVGTITYGPTYPTPDALEMTLALPQKPLETNGQWDSNAGKVKWSEQIPVGTNLPLPVICYATWSEPNVEFQHAHFGRIVLQGDDLYAYVLWSKTLSQENLKHWQQLLGELTPENAVKKLEGFRFRDDAKRTASTPSQPSTLPAGKASAWAQRIVENLNKAQQGSMFERTLE